MKFSNLIGVILPQFEKSRLLTEIEEGKKDLETTTYPTYRSATNAFGMKELHSPEAVEFNKKFLAELQLRGRGNYIAYINTLLGKMVVLYPKLTVAVEKKFAEDVTVAGMTFTRATLIQLIGATRTFQDYARTLLRWTYSVEAAAVSGPELAVTVYKLLPVEIKKLVEERDQFLQMFVSINEAVDAFDKIEKIPDINIEKDTVSMVESSRGFSNLDPFNTRYFTDKPIMFVIRKWFSADRQIIRHRKLEAEREMLELQLQFLTDAQSGKNDPRIQRRIDVTKDRLVKLEVELDDLES